MRPLSLLALFTAIFASSSVVRAQTAPPNCTQRAIVISVDGLMPETYLRPDTLGLSVPTLRALRAEGAYAERMTPVFPTVTYPSHTTMVTGVPPSRHGIISNHPPDPLGKNLDGWRWYAADVAVPTLWDAVEASGRHAAIAVWPVTVGAKASYVVPEFWRASGPDEPKLLRAVATPGLLEGAVADHPDLWDKYRPPSIDDGFQFAIAAQLLRTKAPALLLTHVWQTDSAQHWYGPRTAETNKVIERLDARLGEFIAGVRALPCWDETLVLVVSDHGFAPVEWQVRLEAAFVENGLIVLDAEGKAVAVRAHAVMNGGSAYVYIDDPAAAPDVELALRSLGKRIKSVLGKEWLTNVGGDRAADLLVIPAENTALVDGRRPPAVVQRSGGAHGFVPEDPRMAASFIAVGGSIAPQDLGTVRMIDIAPTVAKWLGIPFPTAEGKPIPLQRR